MLFADPDGVLGKATGPRGHEQRFYPAGSHPATAKLRERLFTLERLLDQLKAGECDHEATDEAIAMCRREIRKFEIGHDVEKAEYLLAYYTR